MALINKKARATRGCETEAIDARNQQKGRGGGQGIENPQMESLRANPSKEIENRENGGKTIGAGTDPRIARATGGEIEVTNITLGKTFRKAKAKIRERSVVSPHLIRTIFS